MKKLLAKVIILVLVIETFTFNTVFAASAADTAAYNGHTYQVFDDPMTWHTAKELCESLGGHLAAITSSEEESYIIKLIDKGKKSAYWIGLTDEKTEGNWEWVTGEKLNYDNWAPNQPDNENTAGNEDYVELCSTSVTNYNWMWNDNVNEPTDYTTDGHKFDQHGFICEWEEADGGSSVNSSDEQEEITALLGKSIILSINSPRCYVWGKQTYVDKENLSVMPIIRNGRTLVPIRFVAESLGGTAEWDKTTNTATIKSGNDTIRITTNSKTMYVNNKAVILDAPAQNINGRTLIPLRAISETLDKQVGYYKGFIIVSDGDIILNTKDSRIQNMLECIRYSMLVYGSQSAEGQVSFMNKSVGKNNYYAIASDALPFYSAKNKLACAASGIFMENIKCTVKDSGNYNLSMDVYNTMYSYGAIEIYNAEGEWLKTIKIERFEGSPTSIKDTAASAWDATYGVGWSIGNAIKGDTTDIMYRNSTISEYTNVNTTIPKGSFLYITNSSADSQYVMMYNVISVAVDSVSLGSSLTSAFTEPEKVKFLKAVKDEIMEEVSDKIQEGTVTSTEFANIVAMDYGITSISDYVAAVTQKSLGILKGLDIDIAEILRETAKEMGKDITTGTVETLFKKATAFIGTAMDICFSIGKTTNYFCFISDIRKTMNSDSLLLVVGSTDNKNGPASVNFSILQEYGGKLYTLHNFAGGQGLPAAIKEYVNRKKNDLVQSSYDVSLLSFAIYEEKIYYLVSEAGTDCLKGAICCCDLDGTDNRLLANDLTNFSFARIQNDVLSYETYDLSYSDSGNGSSQFSSFKQKGVGRISLKDLSRSATEGDLLKYFFESQSKAPVPFESEGKEYYGDKKSVYCRDAASVKTHITGTFDLPVVYGITVLESYDNYIYCQVITDNGGMSKGLYNTRLYRMNTNTGKYEYLTSWHTS